MNLVWKNNDRFREIKFYYESVRLARISIQEKAFQKLEE